MTSDTNPMMDRRTLLTGAAALTAAGALHPNASQAQAVPNSVGTAQPKLKAPANACDCHHHIYDPGRFPFAPNAGRNSPSNGTAADYKLLQKRIGTTRSVVVQPRNYAVDNAVTLDAIARLGPNNTRGVAVLHPTVTDAELKKLNDGGVRGIRFTLGDPATAVVTVDMIEPLAKRIANLGWHIQFNVSGNQIVELAELMRGLPTTMVFDHLANPPLPAGADHPSHAVVR
ncbi:MAG TPA: amidohydrolase family protein, partial [Xanthobacteraceae bacterium]|nr:amidohydrolase family protein [Xanthobacteraceae bacterium]